MDQEKPEEVKESPQRILALQESARKRVAEYLHGHVQSKLLALQYYLSRCQELLTVSPNPPKDTDGRREGSGRGWVRELQGRWPGVLG